MVLIGRTPWILGTIEGRKWKLYRHARIAPVLFPAWFSQPCPTGYVRNKYVSMCGIGWWVEIPTSKFMTIQQALQPDWFQCLSDGEMSCEPLPLKEPESLLIDCFYSLIIIYGYRRSQRFFRKVPPLESLEVEMWWGRGWSQHDI